MTYTSIHYFSISLCYEKRLFNVFSMYFRKFILDSLPMVGTSASVEVMTEMLLANKVTGVESDYWITSFTFIQHPDKFMIKQLKVPNTNRAWKLGIYLNK